MRPFRSCTRILLELDVHHMLGLAWYSKAASHSFTSFLTAAIIAASRL
jgi:hypothetical protein